jgi:CDP-diacylglycerol--glycerol-3-phosphate 3-phosphatidyltransferase
MERAERVVALAIGLAIRPILVPVLWVMLVLTAITALQRFLKVWRQASPTMPEHPAERRLAGTRLARWWRARSEGPPRSGAQRWRTRRGPRVRP